MDGALFSLLFFFFVQIAAGVAPLRWPRCRWLAGVILWISMLGAVGCVFWYFYSNRGDILSALNGLYQAATTGTVGEITLPRLDMLAGVIVGGLVLFSTVLMIRGIRIMHDPYLTMRRVIAMQWAGWLLMVIGCVIAVVGLTIVAHGAERRSDPRGITYASQEFPSHQIRRSARNSQIQLAYMNECNSPVIQTLFHRTSCIFPSGKPAARRMTAHRYYVGITNASHEKTLRNARVVVHSVSLGLGSLINKPLLCERSNNDHVDVAPQSTEYFLIGGGIDASDFVSFDNLYLDDGAYRQALKKAETEEKTGRFTVQTNPPQRLLLNDGYTLELHAFAEDAGSISAIFSLNTKTSIQVILREVKGLNHA